MQAPTVCLWSGYSRLDGAPVVVLATGLAKGSKNSKTGAMVQTWILRADMSPRAAIDSGADISICGDCGLRGNLGKGRTCYVRIDNAPRSVWASWQRGNVPMATDADRALLKSMPVRIGSYGDPAAVPVEIWDDVRGADWTAYTHQWRRFPDTAAWAMASVDSPAEHHQAREMGLRTFRVASGDDAALRPREIECLSTSIGKSCVDCGLCKGAALGGAKSIAIAAHGASKRSVGLSVLQ